MKSIPVNCEGRSYKVHVGLGIFPRAGRILKDLNLSKRLVVISNRQVLKLYGTTLDQSFRAAGFDVSIISLPDGERYKSLATIEKDLPSNASIAAGPQKHARGFRRRRGR